MYIGGYRLGTLVAGAGALYLAEFYSWAVAYSVMAALMLVGMITVLLVPEPVHLISRATYENEARVIRYLEGSAHLPDGLRRITAWFIGAVVCPFMDFFARNGSLAITILLLISVFRITDITMASMANPFYYDLGYSKVEVANYTKLFGFFMTLTGAALGGILVVRYGIMRPLLVGAVSVALTNLLFAVMAWTGYDLRFLALVIGADSLSGGFATAAFIAYLSSLTNQAYTATQYALFSSLMTLVPKILAGFSGIIVDLHGYVFFFIYASVTGIPAILLVLYLMRHNNVDQADDVKAKPGQA
jgi:MFS transporter, PAT family, beta-lactamase induction signal transducer AmpG